MASIGWFVAVSVVAAYGVAIDCEMHAVVARREVVSGRFEGEISYSQGEGESPSKSAISVWFDGESVRIDRDMRDATGDTVKRRRALTDSQFLDYIDGVGSDGRRFALVVARNEDLEDEVYQRRRAELFDPRALGMVPINVDALHLFSVTSYLTRLDRKSVVATDVFWGEWPAKQIDFDLAGGGTIRIVCVPAQGNGVVSLTATASAEDGGYRDVVNSTLKEWRHDVWFPERVEYRREVGDRSVERETIEITDAEFNGPVDPIVFEAVGLDIRAGTGVLDHPRFPEGGRVFDGTRLMVKTREGATALEEESRSSWDTARWRLVIGINVLLVGVVVGVVTFFQLQKRGPNK